MFIAIFIAILLATGLYFLVKHKKSPEDVAKANFEKVFRSTMEQTKQMAIAMSRPDLISELPALQSEVAHAEAALWESMKSIHQEFGIAIILPPEIQHNYLKPDIDVESIKLEWVSCPSDIETCFVG